MERNEHAGVYRDIEDFEAELGRRGIGSGDIVNSRFPERAGRIAHDPTLRAAEELAIATGREEVIDQP